MKKVNRYVPEKAYDFISKSNYKNKEHLYIILDMVNRITIFRKYDTDYSNKFVDIPKEYFRDIICDSKSISNSMDYLKSNGILDCDGIYSKEKGKALGYRVNNNYFSKLIKIEIEKPTLTKKIMSNVNKEKSRVNDKYKKYKSFFASSFKINFEKANNHLTTHYLNHSLCRRNLDEKIKSINRYNHLYMSISAINDGELFFRHNKTNGRIDTNLTNLKSELKQFISIPNLIQLDIVNSQPYILSLYLKSKGLDGSKFISWTERGIFYENFEKEYYKQTGKTLTRKEVKEIMFCIFYSKNESYKKEKSIFKSIFPKEYEMIEIEKMNKHNQLAIKMQRLESEICIDTICQELDKVNVKYFTIHDAWIVDRLDEFKVKEIVEKEFMKKYRSIPKIKIEQITK